MHIRFAKRDPRFSLLVPSLLERGWGEVIIFTS